MRGLDGKGVLIVGGTSGIGLATARRFLEEGSRVFVAGNDEAELKETRATLAELGAIDGVVGDVSLEDDVEAIVRAAAAFLARIDVLINNAGVAHKAPFLETRTEAWDRTIRLMAADGAGGAIVNMASTNALGGEELYAAYNASKGGVLQLTRTMAVELGSAGIRVNCLCPGFIDTPLNRGLEDEAWIQTYEREHIPLGRRGRADEVAAVYAFLASEEASFMHGAALVIDGGQTAVM